MSQTWSGRGAGGARGAGGGGGGAGRGGSGRAAGGSESRGLQNSHSIQQRFTGVAVGTGCSMQTGWWQASWQPGIGSDRLRQWTAWLLCRAVPCSPRVSSCLQCPTSTAVMHMQKGAAWAAELAVPRYNKLSQGMLDPASACAQDRQTRWHKPYDQIPKTKNHRGIGRRGRRGGCNRGRWRGGFWRGRRGGGAHAARAGRHLGGEDQPCSVGITEGLIGACSPSTSSVNMKTFQVRVSGRLLMETKGKKHCWISAMRISIFDVRQWSCCCRAVGSCSLGRGPPEQAPGVAEVK